MSDTDNPKKKPEEDEGVGEEQPPKILQEMDKRLQNLEQGQAALIRVLQTLADTQAEMLRVLQRLDEESIGNEKSKAMHHRLIEKEKRFDYLGKDFRHLLSYLWNSVPHMLSDFSMKHRSLFPPSSSETDEDLYVYLYRLWEHHVMFYLIKKKYKDLTTVFEYENAMFMNLNSGIPKEVAERHIDPNEFWKELIAKARGLNSEKKEEREQMAHEHTRLLQSLSSTIKGMEEVLFEDGKKSKIFWMEGSLQKFFRFINERIDEYIEGSTKWCSIPEQIAEEYSGEIYEGAEGKKKIMKAIFGEVFAEFEKDLRDVQKDVLEHWESAKHWWEKREVQASLIIVAVLSVASSLITIVDRFIPEDWARWLLPVIVGGLLAAGYFVYKMIKRRKNRW